MNEDFEILIVDDEQVIVESIHKICGFLNHSVITATSSTEALEILNRKKISLIVADIMMPEVNGFDFLSEIIRLNIPTPVILTSGNASLDIIHRSFSLGAIDFLPKPFSFDELESFIVRGLSASELLKAKRLRFNSIQDLIFITCPSNYKKFGKWNWLSSDNNIIKIGLSDFLIKTIGTIQKIVFKEVGENIVISEMCIEIVDSNNLTHNIISPISGVILEINRKVLENHSILEKDPYFEGWIYKLKCSNFSFEEKYLLSCTSE